MNWPLVGEGSVEPKSWNTAQSWTTPDRVAVAYDALCLVPPGDAPRLPVVFVHGLNSSRTVWFAQLRSMAATHPVVCVDMRGHGQSGRPESGYSIPGYAADIVALLDHLGLDRVHLVGTSLGGFVVQHLAVSHPDLVDSLTLVGTSYEMRDIDIEELAVSIERDGTGAVLRPFVEANTFAPGTSEALIEFVMEVIAAEPAELSAKRWRAAKFDGIEAARAISCATLIVHGDRDRTIPPDAALALHDMIRDSQLCLLPGCGHMPFLEMPDIFTAVLLRFLMSRDQTPTA